LRNVGVFIRKRVWLENSLSHLAQAIFKPNLHTYVPMKMEQSVPKRRHIKFSRRGITQKKAYNIRNMAKVWNQEYFKLCFDIVTGTAA